MPNFEQPQVNKDEQMEPKSFGSFKEAFRKAVMLSLITLATYGPAKGEDKNFESSNDEKTEHVIPLDNTHEQKLDSIGTPLNIELENKDLEARSIYFSELGFKSTDDFENQFEKFLDEHESEFSNVSWYDGVEAEDAWARGFLLFVNSKLEKLMGSDYKAFQFTKADWSKVRQLFKKRAEQRHILTQVGAFNETYVGNKEGGCLGYNECETDKYGNRQINTGSIYGFPNGNYEFVVAVNKID